MSFRLYAVEQHWWSFADYAAVLKVVDHLQPRRVLEFGPGSSTLALIEGGAGHVDCCEDDAYWFAAHSQRIAAAYPGAVTMISYAWADPLTIPGIDGRQYDLALIDGPAETMRRPAVLEYCLERATNVLVPLEEKPEEHLAGWLRPRVLAAAEAHGRDVQLIDTGPLAGTFALLC